MNNFWSGFEKQASAMKEVATVALIHNGHMLMGIRRDNKRWTNPGGHLEKGERPLDGAVRETKEETGASLDPKSLVSLGSKTVVGPDGVTRKIHPFKVLLSSRPKTDSSADPDKEVAKWRWMPMKKLPAPLHVPLERNTLLQRLGLDFEKAALSNELAQRALKAAVTGLGHHHDENHRLAKFFEAAPHGSISKAVLGASMSHHGKLFSKRKRQTKSFLAYATRKALEKPDGI